MAKSELASPALLPPACNSSLLEKLEPDLLRRLDQALVDRRPPTYRAVYDQFALHTKGVSYTAFYYYARRIRINAAMIEMAGIAPHDGPPSHELLPDVLAQRFLEASLDEDVSPGLLQRLADAYRVASQTYFARRRLAAQVDEAKLKRLTRENDDLCKALRELAQLHLAESLPSNSDAPQSSGGPAAGPQESPAAPQPEASAEDDELQPTD